MGYCCGYSHIYRYYFYKYIIQKDYIVTARVDCNPNTEDCFYLPCGESECSTEEISYFKLVEKRRIMLIYVTAQIQSVSLFSVKKKPIAELFTVV